MIVVLIWTAVGSALIAFFLIAFNVAAIRRMLENMGLFSGIPCSWCRMPVPEGAEICGHCGRELSRVNAA